MRIAFNGQRLSGQRLGVGRYIEYLLRYMGPLLTAEEELVVYTRRPIKPGEAPWDDQIQVKELRSRLDGVPWENFRLRWPASRADVLFCPAYTAPVGYRGRFVVATHSVNERSSAAHGWAYRQTYARLHRHAARRASAVIVPAEATGREVVEAYGVDPSGIVVVPQGADDAFQPVTDPGLLRATRTRFFGGDRPYILFVGKCSVRRNIPMLLQAFARLRHEVRIPHGLLLFGPNHLDLPVASICRELGIEHDVVQTDGIVAEHTDLVPIYAAAEVFVHPSEFEGWSMTTVEALACGTPVVASDRGGLGEVARGHALMVPNPTVDDLADAIGRVLSDDVLREELRRRARARGATLRWPDTAQQTLDVLRQVAAAIPIQRQAMR